MMMSGYLMKLRKILNEIGLPRQDLGVDLTKSGNNHAIQCKYHSNKHQRLLTRKCLRFARMCNNYGLYVPLLMSQQRIMIKFQKN